MFTCPTLTQLGSAPHRSTRFTLKLTLIFWASISWVGLGVKIRNIYILPSLVSYSIQTVGINWALLPNNPHRFPYSALKWFLHQAAVDPRCIFHVCDNNTGLMLTDANAFIYTMLKPCFLFLSPAHAFPSRRWFPPCWIVIDCHQRQQTLNQIQEEGFLWRRPPTPDRRAVGSIFILLY